MKKLILTALNNNDEIWYRCFIPFILSLKATNYDGDIGIISYQLSENKLNKLRSHGIIIFSPENRFSELLIDRHITTARISANNEYQYIALYDADIWFTSHTLTIFDQIKDNQKLYCSYDVIYPNFLTNGVPNNKEKEIKDKIAILYQKQQFFWQAGIILGSSEAWLNYSNYISETLNNLHDFEIKYGIDATTINLYSCDTDNIAHLPEKYNCLPFWGIRLQSSPTGDYYALNGERLEGAHITRYHRESKEYNYLHFYTDVYLSQGAQFSLHNDEIKYYSLCGNLFSKLPQKHQQTLTIQDITCNYLLADIDKGGLLYQKGDLIFDFSAKSKMTLLNHNPVKVDFYFSFQKAFNKRLPVSIDVYRNEVSAHVDENKLYLITLNPNETFTIMSNDIWSENCAIRYIFRNVTLI